MAFRASIMEVSRAGLQINVTMRFRDDDTGKENVDIVAFQNGHTLEWADIIAEAQARGQRYKDALARELILRENIGAEMVI
jgi:hypothetical protein